MLQIEELITRLENEWDIVTPQLVQIGEPAVGPLIEAFTEQKNSTELRIRAARALREIGDPRAIGSFLAYFDDMSNPKRHSIALLFGKLYDERAIERLLKAAVEEDANMRSAALCSLITIGEPRTRELLLHALECVANDEEPDEIMRSEVITFTRSLMRTLNDREGFLPAIRPLQKLIHDPDEWIQKNAAKTLAEFD